jgi:uncharacterized protein
MPSKKNTVRANVERRVFNLTNCEVREATDGGPAVFSGYAAVFNELSVNLGGFRERIQPGCFRNAVDEGQDVRFLINHDASQVLGRTKSGTVTLVEDEVGLRVECELGNRSYENDLKESMARGDVDQMSFGFVTRSDDWKVKDEETGLPIRELLEADLFDVSVVTYPAYPDTTASVRSEIQEEHPELLERAKRAAEELADETVAETPDTPDTDDETETPDEEREVETTMDELAEAAHEAVVAEYEMKRSEAGARIEEDHPCCEGVAVVWNFNNEVQSCHLTRDAAEATLAALMSGAAGAARADEEEDRAGKVLSSKNKETISEAMSLLSAVLDASEATETVDESKLDNAIAGLNDQLPNLADFRASLEALEERAWSWEDDYAVWSLTQMIEAASIFLLYADDQNDEDAAEDAAQATAMKAILAQLTELLAAVVAEGARSDEQPEAEERNDDDVAETEEREERSDLERRLRLRELELSL